MCAKLIPIRPSVAGKIGEAVVYAVIRFLHHGLKVRMVPRSGSGKEKGDLAIDSIDLHLEVKTIIQNNLSPERALRIALKRGQRDGRIYEDMIPVAVVLRPSTNHPGWEADICSCGDFVPGRIIRMHMVEDRLSVPVQAQVCHCMMRISKLKGGKENEHGRKKSGRCIRQPG